jgi:hypothetical protein
VTHLSLEYNETVQLYSFKQKEAKIMFKAKDLKIPAVHPDVICVGGFNKDDQICMEYYHGEGMYLTAYHNKQLSLGHYKLTDYAGIDIYAPAKRMPWLDKEGHMWDQAPLVLSDHPGRTENGTSYGEGAPSMQSVFDMTLS